MRTNHLLSTFALGIALFLVMSNGSYGAVLHATMTESIGKTIYVDDDFNENTPGWNIDHFNTIASGVTAANSGDTVFVFNGTYHEGDIRINQRITLRGENNTKTIVFGFGYNDTFIVAADFVRVCNLTIRMTSNYGIRLLSDYNEISDCIIRQNGGCGIYILGHGNLISNNTIKNNAGYGGIYIEHAAGNRIVGNTIKSNSYGIRAFLSRMTFIRGNNIEENDAGIYLRDVAGSMICLNDISSNTMGVYLSYSGFCIITMNDIYDNSVNASFEKGFIGIFLNKWLRNYWGNNRFVEPIQGEIIPPP